MLYILLTSIYIMQNVSNNVQTREIPNFIQGNRTFHLGRHLIASHQLNPQDWKQEERDGQTFSKHQPTPRKLTKLKPLFCSSSFHFRLPFWKMWTSPLNLLLVFQHVVTNFLLSFCVYLIPVPLWDPMYSLLICLSAYSAEGLFISSFTLKRSSSSSSSSPSSPYFSLSDSFLPGSISTYMSPQSTRPLGSSHKSRPNVLLHFWVCVSWESAAVSARASERAAGEISNHSLAVWQSCVVWSGHGLLATW